MHNLKPTIGIIGLGYVGLPLAVAFAKKYKVIGFDINENRIQSLKSGHDATLEVSDEELREVIGSSDIQTIEQADGRMFGQSDSQTGGQSDSETVGESGNQNIRTAEKSESPNIYGLKITSTLDDLKEANFYIVTVPTPIDKHHRPDLTPLIKASETVSKVLKKGDYVVYESTVYPGVTEEVCAPILEERSSLKVNTDFFIGYSPERINPGDKEHTVTKILKITAGSTPNAAKYINDIYGKVIMAGTYCAPSIKVAEAAKVIENSQRDINIAFVNELAMIFNRLGIDTTEVLKAAGTKWNFLPFRPGLVGGHCIGVDPYYLAQKAQEIGYHPEIILAGRRLNDSMGNYIASEVIKQMVRADMKVKDSSILVLGITFKENCPDIRNSRVIDIVRELDNFGAKVEIVDPWAKPEEIQEEYGVGSIKEIPENLSAYSAVVIAVAHADFKQIDFSLALEKGTIVYDVKGVLDVQTLGYSDFRIFRL